MSETELSTLQGAQAEDVADAVETSAAGTTPAHEVNDSDAVYEETTGAPAGGGPSQMRARVEYPELEEDTGPTYYRIGVDHEYDPADEEIHFQCTRIRKLENLEPAGANLKTLCLIANCLDKIENLETNVNLRHLELYQNLIKKIENISHLTSLTVLDLSFNKIRSSAPLGSCEFTQLEKLYLSSNKISDIEGVFHLTALTMLEYGCNRLRAVPPELEKLSNLQELWLGKNKIVSMALPPLPKLRHLSMQNNRLETWEGSLFTNASSLTHLYLGHNNLPDLPEEFSLLTNLVEVDLAKNAITVIRPMPQLTKLEELWMNDCQIKTLEEVRNLGSFRSLRTVYLERNPMHGLGNTASEEKYKAAILEAVPDLVQLDALTLNSSVTVITDGSEKTVIGIRKA